MWGKIRITTATIILSLFLMLAVLSPICQSSNVMEEPTGTPDGWTDDIRITNFSNNDVKAAISVDENDVYLVWERTVVVSSDYEIYFTKSNNSGESWDDSKQISNSGIYAANPDVDGNNSHLHVVWSDWKTPDWEIFYRNSTDGGESWNSEKRISVDDGFNSEAPEIFVNKSNLHTIWIDNRDGSDSEIYYRRSLDGGTTFENGQGVDEDRRITFSPAAITATTIGGDGSNISVIWSDMRDGDWEIYWMISKDNGVTWQDGLGTINVGRKISDDLTSSGPVAIAVNGSQIHIIWVDMEFPGPLYRLYYRNSTDNGVTWNPIQLLVDSGTSYNPSIDAFGKEVHVVWDDWRDNGSTKEIYYKNSTDSGATWGPETRLTAVDDNSSAGPKIALSGSKKHITWIDQRDSNSEIYYKRFPDFPPEPTYNITLNEGWNLISSPLIQRDESLDVVLENISGKWDYILAYNSTDPDHWKSNDISKPGPLNDLTEIDHTIGFWINITEPGGCNLTLSGIIPTNTQIPLKAGWNLVGYPTLNNSVTVGEAFFGTGATRVEVCNTSQAYNQMEVMSTYIMRPGEGYWVKVPADSIWVVDW
ncbi:MAG: exo-alpha-sialidase [Thermoplasmata archaeon]|nr:exo-alpha-sialidase [Thermoplasmata archaeon]